MAYQGPNVQVTQNFVTSPAAVAVENLPAAGIGTAFDVYNKEKIGEAYGIVTREALWGADKVIYDPSVIGLRGYDFYPAVVYAETPFGNIEFDATKSSTGAEIEKDDAYVIPGTEKVEGICQAFIPFYNQNLGVGNVKILATDLQTVIGVGASFATAKIQAGQSVFMGLSSDPTTFVKVGTVAAVGADETKIKLVQAYSAATPLTFDTVVVGAADRTTATLIEATSDRPNCLYNSTADFISTKIKVGDLVVFESLGLASAVTATITAIVNKNLIKFNTVTPTATKEDYDFYSYKTSTAEPGSSIAVSTYSIQRLVGFSQNYGMKDINSGVVVKKISATSFSVGYDPEPTTTTPSPSTPEAPLLSKGDYFVITTTNSTSTLGSIYQIDTVTVDTVNKLQIYTTTETIKDQAGSNFVDGDFLHAWHPMRTHNILADFRAIRTEETQVVKRITSQKDITTAWSKDDTISPYNEIAYAMSIALASAGGNVCYGVNVDASATSLSAEYAEAMESLKMYEVYTHFLCTTDGGINALMSSYVDEQSAPYEAHERIGIICYDEKDVYLQGSDSGDVTSGGVITIDGAINLATIGVTVGDTVEIYKANGELQETVNVTATPEASLPSVCHTDGTSAYTGYTFKFMSGRKNDQAIRIGNLGSGNRRVTTIWPGWFTAAIGNTAVVLPPYYIAAAVAGMDSVNNPSKSFTNRLFALPGVSNIQLNTSSYFRKADLDEIGGGGVDVMIQDSNISQSIKSRHDLTGNMDAVEYRERSITKQADVSAKTIRSAFAPYVGKYNITASLISFLSQIAAITGTTLIKNGIVANMQTMSIQRDSVIVDKININITITVFVAGNYYDIQMLIVSR